MRLVIPMILLLPSLLLSSQLTLQQAKENAVQYNPLLMAQKARVEGAQEQSREAEGFRMPSLDLSSSFIRTNQPASAFALELNQKKFSMMNFSMSDPNNPDYLNTTLTALNLSLPLFTGGQITHAVRAARAQTEGYSLEYERKKQELLQQVTKVYLGILLADEYTALTGKARDTVARHVQMARDYYETGFVVESDLLRAQVELAKVESRLITVKNQATTARIVLNILMGSDPDAIYTLTPVPVEGIMTASDSATSVQTALANRPDLKFLDKMIEALEENVKRLKGSRLPTVGLMVTQEWYDDTFLGDRGDATTYAVGLTIPLYHGGRIKAKIGQARAQRDGLSSTRKALEDGVVLQVKQALANVEEARSRMRVARGNEKAAQKNLEIIEERYKKGIVKITDLLDADTTLTEARTRSLHARYDTLLALEDYLLSIGKEN